jgi:hypothetical protein
MATLDPRPEHGIRIKLDSTNEDGPPWVYEGTAATNVEQYRVRATIEVGGNILVESTDAMPPELVVKVRAMIAATVSNEVDAQRPSQIHRWRSSGAWPKVTR